MSLNNPAVKRFLKRGIINIQDMSIKKCNKKIGSPCVFTSQQVLKMGYYYCLRIFLRVKFPLFKQAVLLHLIKPFLIAWFWEYCTF